MITPAADVGEKSLSGMAKYGLILTATLIIAFFYCFVFFSIVILLLILAGEFIVFIALARFGAAGVITPLVQRHGKLFVLFARCVWTRRRRAEFQVPLEEPDAPALFLFLRELSRRLQVPVPRRVRIEMTASAWVRLRGLHRGSNSTTLGLGYDLVVALSEREIEAVLAHEMTHAKHVRRGLQTWLNGGLARAGILTNELSAMVGGYRRARQKLALGEWFLNPADRCMRLMVRLVSTYSRQDEFEADRGAAEICGAAPLRSSLLKLDQLHAKTARIGWNERVAQLQRSNGFSVWLAEELAIEESPLDNAASLQDLYSTHPSTRDRLAALPVDLTPIQPSRRAIELLANPDDVAARLVKEIHRVAHMDEERDSRDRRRWLKRLRRGAAIQPLQWLGLLIGIIAIIIGSFAWVDQFSPTLLGIALLVMATAVAVYRLGHKRDRRSLPVPDYEILKFSWENPADPKVRETREIELTAAFKSATGALARKKLQRDYLATESYTALAQCDYLRAHVAACQCMQLDGKFVEARIALAVASAAFHQSEQARNLLVSVVKATGLRSPSTMWAAAWALLLLGDWAAAEALLAELTIQRPHEMTFPALLAICQSRRHKVHGAIAHARIAFASSPGNSARTQLLVELLLDGGYLREAEILLMGAGDKLRSDSDLTQSMVRLHLLRRDFTSADQWIETLRQHDLSGQVCVQLAGACELARRDELAKSFYETALGQGYYPAAHLGLARLATHRRDFAGARQSIMTSLNTSCSLGAKASSAQELFSRAIEQILVLETPIPNARAWFATFQGNTVPGPLIGLSFRIFAVDEKQAVEFLKTIVGAMQPNQPPFSPTSLVCLLAPRDQQPVGAVRPGVQYFWS